MKFGAHSYIFTDQWTDASLNILDEAKALGLDLVEIGVGDDVVFDVASTRCRAEELGLELAISPGGLWPQECDLSADDSRERRLGLDWHKRQIDLAAELNAIAYTGAIYGHPGTVKRRRPPTDEIAWVAAGLRALCEYAARARVQVVLEPMSHFRTHLVNTPEQAMRLVELVDHDRLSVLLDTYHMVTEVKDYGAAIETVGTRLWGIHACESNRGAPGGGLVPWDVVFDALKSTEFDGYVVMETYNSSIGEFAYERAMFHNVCPDSNAFIIRGLSFLRDGLGCV